MKQLISAGIAWIATHHSFATNAATSAGRKALYYTCAIRQVLGGRIYVSEKMSAEILETFSGRRAGTESSPVEKLTNREFEVFQLIGQGRGTREIAKKLHLSVKTVEVHRANIKAKLKLKSTTELIRFAVRWLESQSAGV